MRLNEQELGDDEDDKELSTKKISRLSFKLANRVKFTQGDKKTELLAALQLLTQSLLILDKDSTESRRLYNVARKLG